MSDPLEAIAGPLRFAARNEFRNIARVRGLERALAAATIRALESATDPALRARLERIGALVIGFDDTPNETKIVRVQKILALVAGADEPAGEEKAPAPAKTKKSRAPKDPNAPKKPKDPNAPKKPKAPKRVPAGEAGPDTPLDRVIGVGPKTAEKLAAKGLVTVADALLYLPRRYDDRREFTPVAELQEGEHASVRGTVAAATIRYAGRRVFEMAIKDDTGVLNTRFFRFHSKAMEQNYPRGQAVVASGKVSRYGAQARMIHPELERIASEELATPQGLVAIYPEIDGVPERTLRRLLRELAKGAAPKLPDPFPEEMRARLKLPALGEAVRAAHVPDEPADQETLRRRLVFDELFYLQLALAIRKSKLSESPGRAHKPKKSIDELAKQLFPFELTRAQKKAIAELAKDLARKTPMARLLQGDVGCGKTAVAMIAANIVVDAGHQAALLAPTEILAAQHYKNAQKTSTMRAALLTGSLKTKERRALLQQLADQEIDLLIGTHALLEPDVIFKDLGLAIIDEQHRFGVAQRKTMRDKNQTATPDLLVMTATPIPRTLAMAFYGDLALTVIDEMPPGRTPVVTKLVDHKRRSEVYAHLDRTLAEGRQAFVVYPLVEMSEKLDLAAATDAVDELAARFPKHQVALLHGRMKPDEKSAAMERFVKNETQLLVSTTVVEVGVDVPNATAMVIEHAERFGLSQLHQLRGRVGRGKYPGACFLIAGGGGQDALERLSILAASADGFAVAEHDLKTRGPGEMLGTRQHGLPDLILADLLRDADVLELAREEALAHLDPSPSIKGELLRRFSDRLDLLDAG